VTQRSPLVHLSAGRSAVSCNEMDGLSTGGRPMTDIRWIISVHKFYEHETIESMETELARLKTLFPEKEST
jgi:hypothetical protein